MGKTDPTSVGQRSETHPLAGEPAESEKQLQPARQAGGLGGVAVDLDTPQRVNRAPGTVQDMTEREAAQGVLQDSADQFRTFAQTLPNHVWSAAPDGQLDWFNDRMLDYSGATEAELRGQGWTGLVHPEDLAGASERWAAALASGETYETEFRTRRADGAYRWHLVRAVPTRGSLGTISRWFGTSTDIHERKLAEQQHANDRERLWSLSQELMLVCDFSGLIRAVNPAAQRILGWAEGEMVGQTLASFLHPDDLASTAAEVEKLSRGATTLAFENRYRASDGSYRSLDWAAVPEGGLIHAVARDVSRERLAEEALRQAQKMEAVGQLTGGVAHDFNNLLTIVRTSIDLLQRRNPSEERRQRLMESISNAVTRATKLTGQLLAFARRQALQPVAFDSTQNVRAVSEMVATLAGSRIALQVEAQDEHCIVNADPSQFDTAIVNLAVNARDAMEGAGRLTIGVRNVSAIPALRAQPAVPGHYVALSVTDTGCGIDAAQIDRIFEPFFTTKPVGLGTGLGLSQVFGFAKQSGGDIQVESTPGHGSTFTLYLPQAQLDSPDAVPHDDAAATEDGHGATVLVIEDNVEVASSVEASLCELGYQAVVAHGAEAALALVQAEPQRFAVVFSDVVMAGMDGIAMAREIRRRHSALPVVLSSGYSDVLARDDTHGFVLLPKPYSVEALARTLKDAISKRPAALPQRARPSLADGPHALIDKGNGSEEARQSELESMLIVDTPEEASYDELTHIAARFFDTPIALISLIDGDRQWFKSHLGLQTRETPREYAFCAHAIENPEQLMVVRDATQDNRFVDNPLVTGDPNIRFYAGAPLVTSAGFALGTICVIDYRPREFNAQQLAMLELLAVQVVDRIEQRKLQLNLPPDAAD